MPGSSIPEGAAQLELLASVVNNAPVPIFLKDTNGAYLYVNEAYVESGGIAADKIIGKTDVEIYPERTAAAYQSEDRLAMKSATPVQSTWPLEVGDEQRTFRTVKFPIHGRHGEVLGVCGISLDITDTLLEQIGRETERKRVIDAKPFGRLLASLTPQEARVAELLLIGLSDKQIAETLNLTGDTVRHHVSRILKKLRKPSRTQAVIAMLRYRKKD